jgi:hypothetical protein
MQEENQKILKSQTRTGGFFEEGSKLICSICGEEMVHNTEFFGTLSCQNCGNQIGGEHLLHLEDNDLDD